MPLSGTVVLILGAAVLRASAAGLRAGPAHLPLRLVAWLLAGCAAWFAAGAAAAFAPLWPGLLAVVLAPLDRRARNLVLWAAADAGLVAGLGLLSTPPLEPLRLTGAALLMATAGLACDLLLTQPRMPRLFARWAAAPAVLGVLAFLGLTLVPVPGDKPHRLAAAVSLHSGIMPAALPGTGRMTLETGAVAWLDRPPGKGPSPGALFFHGAHPGSSHQPAALALRRALLAAGFVVLAVDHPGYGESPHPPPDAAPAAWDPLPAELAAYEALSATPGVQAIVAVGHSMGNGSVLRLLGAEVPLAAAVMLGAGLATDTEDEAAYWDQRFRSDRGIRASMAPEGVRAIRERYYDSRRQLAALPAGHPPVQFVTFGIEWPNLVATRGAFHALLPGPTTTWELPGATHYMSTFGRRRLVLGDVRATRALAARLQELAAQVVAPGAAAASAP